MAFLSAPKSVLSSGEVSCVFGSDGEALLSAWRPWLEEEENRFLEMCIPTGGALPWGMHPQVQVRSIASGKEEESAKEIAWSHLWRSFTYHIENAELQLEAERFFALLRRMKLGVDLIASDFSDCGVKILGNSWSNSAHLSKAHNGISLKGALKGIPACICGAGPSLEKHRDALLSLKGKALILAGGSAPAALSHMGIAADLIGHIDPDPPQERFKAHSVFEAPLLYQDRVAPRILDAAHGSLIWFPSSGGYPIEQWLYERLGFSAGIWDGGWNAATFLASVAVWMGCNPILFAGVDLLGSEDNLYAQGIPDMQQEKKAPWNRSEQGHLYRSDWKMARLWLEDWMQEQLGVRFFQFPSLGDGLKGASVIGNREWDSWNEIDSAGLVHSLMQNVVPVAPSSADAAGILKEVVARSLKTVGALLALWENPSEKQPEETGAFALYWSDLTEETAYQKILDPLWQVWRHIFAQYPFFHENRTLHTLLYFQRVLKDYKTSLEKDYV